MTTKHAMADVQVWLGRCQVAYAHETDPADASRYSQPAAVWCRDVEGFTRSVKSRLVESGLTLLHAETPLPRDQWLAQHRDGLTREAHTEIRHLMEKAEQSHDLALGYLYAVTVQTAEVAETQDYLRIEDLGPIEPLDGQLGVHPRKTVPDALYESLFGQPEPIEQEIAQYGEKDLVPPMKLYAILDAAKVKTPGLRRILDTSELDFACLLTGQDYDELKDSAPYIVELKEGNDFTRTLFTYNPKFSDKHLSVHLWHQEPGLYVRSRANLIELGVHFAKFVRVRDENGKRFFFRFWEPWHLADALQGFTPEQLSLFLKIETMPHVLIYMKHACCILRLLTKDLPKPAVTLILTQNILQRLGESVDREFFRSLKENALKHIGYNDTLFKNILDNLKNFGFTSRKIIKSLVFWSLEQKCDILSQVWATPELEQSQGMPDEIRFDRLKNLSRRIIKNG